MIEIKEYSPYTMIGILDSLMYLDVNYTMTQSFSPIARHEAKEKLKKQKKHFKASEDDSFTQAEQFDIALDDLTNGAICFGNYHFSLLILEKMQKVQKKIQIKLSQKCKIWDLE